MRVCAFVLAAGLAIGGNAISGNVRAQTVDWSGFYVGGAVGATRGESDTGISVSERGGYFTGADPEQIAGAGNGTLSQWRPSAAVYGGFGRQYGKVVLGVEVDAGTLFFRDDRSASAEYQSSPGTTFTVRQSVTADWQATLRPRLGWAEDNWLVYVTGGLAVARVEMESVYSDTGGAFTGFSRSAAEETRLGWSIGAGGEYALGGNWSLRGEYLYTDLGEITSNSRVTETFGGAPAFLDHSADLRTHALRIGVTYRFQGL